jgi:hypothetical protein
MRTEMQRALFLQQLFSILAPEEPSSKHPKSDDDYCRFMLEDAGRGSMGGL